MNEALEIPGLFEAVAADKLTAEVAVPLPVEGVFSYLLPEDFVSRAKPGVRIRVPFKNRTLTGYLVATSRASNAVKLKSVLEILDDEPVLSPAMLDLTHWIADYYGSSWGEAIENALPKWVKYGKKAERYLARADSHKKTEISDSTIKPSDSKVLSPDQERAQALIFSEIQKKNPRPILLFGVTGSGKSELYLRTIRQTLSLGKSAICLVPEIALTEQLRHFFREEFGGRLEILHSKLSDGERFKAWKDLERGVKSVILGPRSAVFAPVPNLGLIVMDEEHEGSYKQETPPRYHAREVAMWRAKNEGALFLMGSATPSLEIMHQAKEEKILKIDLRSRIDDRPLPGVTILDLKRIQQDRRSRAIISPPLAAEIKTNLAKGQGTMLLLNRRGFFTQIQCPQCGTIETCKSCQVSMTFHQESEVLLCHYCNFQKPLSETCPQCSAPVMRFTGFGTEKVESEAAMLFPTARISRLDADTVRKKGSHEVILKEFRERKTDILIGTQMIAKGFDFPHVTLVGVILADVGLMLPDFRSAERTFQLLTQVAGRAGRGIHPGRVFIQTYSPDHPSVCFSKNHDYENFYHHEVAERRTFNYPPFARLINVMVRAKDESKAYKFAWELRKNFEVEFPDLKPQAPFSLDAPEFRGEIIGPSPLPFYKLRGQFRWHLMLKIRPSDTAISSRVKSILIRAKKPSGVQLALDVDPQSIL